MKRNEEKVAEWKLLLDERKQKGLPVKEFCKEKNITPAQYYYYQEIITQPNKPKKNPQVQKIDKTDIKPIQIVNSVAKESSQIRFILPNSLQCILPRDMAVDEIKKILELLLSC